MPTDDSGCVIHEGGHFDLYGVGELPELPDFDAYDPQAEVDLRGDGMAIITLPNNDQITVTGDGRVFYAKYVKTNETPLVAYVDTDVEMFKPNN